MKNSIVNYISWALQILIALIYLQTLYFKFSAHPDSVYIFSTLGLEPYGRIGIGIFELITSILILLPQTRIYGGILSVGVILGAILAHLGPLGIVVHNDGGKVFYLALTVLIASLLFLWLNRNDVLRIYHQFKQKISPK
ncbi:MAG: DoxX family protein [Chitinophagales bacterium]|nr:DoxX family protein [Chitinophagales bacterium]